MAKQSWKRLSTTTLLTHPRLTVVEDEVLLPDGYQTQYIRYENLLSYVTVIAVRDDKIALLKEYSYPHDEWLWQFPEGSIEPGESAESAAVRELDEEAGLRATEMKALGLNYAHHRRSTEKNYVFVARGAAEIPKAAGDREEQGTELHWVSHEELMAKLIQGHIVQKNALAALALYLAQPR